MTDNMDLKDSWDQIKEKIKESNHEISDEDLAFKPGQQDELFDSLAKKLNKSRDEVRAWIESISQNKTIAG